MSSFHTLKELLATDIAGRYVVARLDLNVPIDKDGKISDPGRITASVPTLRALQEAKAKVVVLAHLGRPKNGPDPALSLRPVAAELSKALGHTVHSASDTIGADALARVEGLLPGDVVVLENVRFDARETSKDDAEREQFAAAIADLVGNDAAFVSDGFGVVHRKQASVYDIAKILSPYAGYLIESEVKVLETLLTDPAQPYAVVLGGSKVSDKLSVIEALAPKVDTLIIVGGMAFTFLAARGLEVGTSLLEKDYIDKAKELLSRYSEVLKLPQDIIAADKFAADANIVTVAADAIPADRMGLDIGPESQKWFSDLLSQAQTIFWNGPAGVFELEPFAQGTKAIAQTLIKAKKEHDAYTVVGGGDSAAAVRSFNFNEADFSHISTGGGASLEYIEGKKLPGLEVLRTNCGAA